MFRLCHQLHDILCITSNMYNRPKDPFSHLVTEPKAVSQRPHSSLSRSYGCQSSLVANWPLLQYPNELAGASVLEAGSCPLELNPSIPD